MYQYRFQHLLKYHASVSIYSLFEVSRIGIDLLKKLGITLILIRLLPL